MDCIDLRYHLIEKIGAGSFGVVYKAYDDIEKKIVALKMEPVSNELPMLYREAKIYKLLEGGMGIPKTYQLYTNKAALYSSYNILAMDLLGPSLENLFERCKRRFSLKTTCQIAVQLLDRIEYIHSKHLIHRDLKPDNFLISALNPDMPQETILHMIDFGMAKEYRNPTTHQHIEYRDGKSLCGTPRYASINAHLGIQSSRRDDLESIAYMLIYFLRGSLPWQGIRARTKKQKYQKIMEKKLATPIDLFCKGYPAEFQTYIEYVRCLRFMDKPDYDYLKRLFAEVGNKHNFTLDNKWDWDAILQPVHEEEENSAKTSIEARAVNEDGDA